MAAFTLTTGHLRQSLCAMKSGISWRGVLWTFLGVVIFYFLSFYGMEYWRQRKGPWEITFSVDGEGNPSMVFDQPKLNISSMEILTFSIPVDVANRITALAEIYYSPPRMYHVSGIPETWK